MKDIYKPQDISGNKKIVLIEKLINDSMVSIYGEDSFNPNHTQTKYGNMEHWNSPQEWVDKKIKPLVFSNKTAIKTLNYLEEIEKNKKLEKNKSIYLQKLSFFNSEHDDSRIQKIAQLCKNYLMKNEDYSLVGVGKWVVEDEGSSLLESLDDYLELLHILKIEVDLEKHLLDESEFQKALQNCRKN